MRQVVLDTESTGLDPDEGHRVIEIGAVELIDRRLSGRKFHHLLQPDRAIDAGAFEVHGITEAKLEDKPRFAEIADELLHFIEGAELVIHNAEFDIAFLDHELGLLGDARAHRRIADACSVLDTLALARKLHPGQRNNLDALCKRYRVDNSRRNLHSALLDAELLAEVYLAMTGGQVALALSAAVSSAPSRDESDAGRSRAPLRVIRASTAEREAHRRRLLAIDDESGGTCLWRRLEARDSGSETP